MKFIFLIVTTLTSCSLIAQSEISGRYIEVFGEKELILFSDSTFHFKGGFSCVFPSFRDVGEWYVINDTIRFNRVLTELNFVADSIRDTDSLYIECNGLNDQYVQNYVVQIYLNDGSYKDYYFDSFTLTCENFKQISSFSILDRTFNEVFKSNLNSSINTFYFAINKLGVEEIKQRIYTVNKRATRISSIPNRTLFNKE